MKRRHFLKTSGMLTTAGLFGPFTRAIAQQSFPVKPIKIQVGFSTGGATDIVVRSLAENASKILGQPIIVENKPGAGGVLPAQNLVSTKPDGYSIGIVPVSVFRLPFITKTSLDPINDFEYIIRLTGFLWGLAVRADSPIKTFADYVQYAKDHPGELSYGTVGSLTTQHLTMEQISRSQGIKLNHVPYKGVSEIIPALIGGHIDSIADASSWIPHVEAGKMRLLVVWSEKRIERFPDVPTLKEVGIDMVQTSPWGLAAPKGTPKPIIDALHDAFHKAMEQQSFKDALKSYDMETQYMNGADFKQFAIDTMNKEKKILVDLGFSKAE